MQHWILLNQINMRKNESNKNPAAVSLGSLGGKARAKKLSAQRRKEIATKASHSRKKKLKTP